MEFNIWFKKQSFLIQVILLIIPVVGAVVELLYRLSAFLKKPTLMNLLGMILFFIIGLAWVGLVLDVIGLALFNNLFLVEE